MYGFINDNDKDSLCMQPLESKNCLTLYLGGNKKKKTSFDLYYTEPISSINSPPPSSLTKRASYTYLQKFAERKYLQELQLLTFNSIIICLSTVPRNAARIKRKHLNLYN